MKSEPDTFSVQDLERKGVAGWDGVRNYQARNFLRTMRMGDQVFFYHSRIAAPAIVGLAEVVREAYPDPSQFEVKSPYYDPTSRPDAPRWQQVDVRFLKAFTRPLTIEEIRSDPQLATMVLVKNSRLSVQPVAPAESVRILQRLA